MYFLNFYFFILKCTNGSKNCFQLFIYRVWEPKLTVNFAIYRVWETEWTVGLVIYRVWEPELTVSFVIYRVWEPERTVSFVLYRVWKRKLTVSFPIFQFYFLRKLCGNKSSYLPHNFKVLKIIYQGVLDTNAIHSRWINLLSFWWQLFLRTKHFLK